MRRHGHRTAMPRLADFGIQPVADLAALVGARDAVARDPRSPTQIVDYVVDLVRATRERPALAVRRLAARRDDAGHGGARVRRAAGPRLRDPRRRQEPRRARAAPPRRARAGRRDRGPDAPRRSSARSSSRCRRRADARMRPDPPLPRAVRRSGCRSRWRGARPTRGCGRCGSATVGAPRSCSRASTRCSRCRRRRLRVERRGARPALHRRRPTPLTVALRDRAARRARRASRCCPSSTTTSSRSRRSRSRCAGRRRARAARRECRCRPRRRGDARGRGGLACAGRAARARASARCAIAVDGERRGRAQRRRGARGRAAHVRRPRASSPGLKVERYLGDGSEFESLREYVPGLDHRAIDWKASARHRKLLCQEFRAERNHQVVLAIDAGQLMSEPLGRHPAARPRDQRRRCCSPGSALRTGDRVGPVRLRRARPRRGPSRRAACRVPAGCSGMTAELDYRQRRDQLHARRSPSCRRGCAGARWSCCSPTSSTPSPPS